jgi:K+-transporting ATPase ATPase C chain
VRAAARQAARLRSEGITPTPDLVTTSGSGVDPDIAPVDAYAQVAAVAKARGLPVAMLRRLVASQVHEPELGFLGSPYVDVLQLNEALARLG